MGVREMKGGWWVLLLERAGEIEGKGEGEEFREEVEAFEGDTAGERGGEWVGVGLSKLGPLYSLVPESAD